MIKMFQSSDFILKMFSLLISFILVHAVYVAIIRPNADKFLAEEKVNMELNENYSPKKSFYVVLKDFEQEACFILMLWACAILGFKARHSFFQKNQLKTDYIDLPPRAFITVPDSIPISKRLKSLPEEQKNFLLPRVLLGSIDRFASTQNIQDASSEVQTLCDEESDRLESELSIIRYIAWAIPSVGFIGTVRGIGEALSKAHLAVEGDITGVTQSLGVAFNSTFVALLISIVLMFIIHEFQRMQEELVLDTKRYCGKWLISRLKTLPTG
ncbi:MAG: MotA/TolQ/ExbB proton channel family protein [Candidatus Omnitrophica bacterium]|nr:MotA/TolQ/ExbB proton channel family protein [Candidatus Omnitrophota bacterium]